MSGKGQHNSPAVITKVRTVFTATDQGVGEVCNAHQVVMKIETVKRPVDEVGREGYDESLQQGKGPVNRQGAFLELILL